MRILVQTLGLLFLIVSFSACSGSKKTVAVTEAEHHLTQKKTEDVTSLEALYWARKDSAKMNFVQADVDFMTGMIGHHAQALVMSALALSNNASPAVQTLAARIINAQKDEIAIMQRWLYERNQPVPQVFIEGLMLTTKMGNEPLLVFDDAGMVMGEEMDNEEHTMNHAEHMANGVHEQHQMNEEMEHNEHEMGEEMEKPAPQMNEEMDHTMHNMDAMESGMMHDHSTMPGMLNQTQLEELAAATGSEFDHLFLRYMIQHHSGAITMVNDLIAVDGAMQELEIGKLAGDVNVDQKTEIERMRLMLMTMFEGEASN